MIRIIIRLTSLLLLSACLASIIGCGKITNPIDKRSIALIDNNVKYDPEVIPIEWSKLDIKPLTGELAEGTIYLIRNGTKYIVNDWWNRVWRFSLQDSKEHLSMTGRNEHDIRPLTHMALTLSSSIAFGIYDESVTGVSRENAKNMAMKLTKSVAKAHYSNTEGGWGNAWQSALWAFDVALAGWLFWEDFSEKDREYIQNCVVTEANRFINYNVPYYRDKSGKIRFPGDSKAEENAWNSNILSIACAMMPNHENYNAWMYKNVELMLSAFARPSDADSSKVVSGFVLKYLLEGSNVNEDGTVINHNIVHPDYQATIALNLLNGICFALANTKIPEAVVFNGDVIYETFVNLDLKDINNSMAGQYIYKRKNDGSASHEINYPNGTDWGTDRQICFFLVDVFADALNLDKNCKIKAKDFALARLPVMKAMQDRNDNGQYYTATDSDKYKSREEWVMWHAALSYMALWVKENNLFVFDKELPLKPAPLNKVKLEIPLVMQSGTTSKATYSLNPGLVILPDDLKFEYLSSDQSIVSITNTGTVYAKKEGKATISITVTYKNIIVSDSVEVEVVKEKKPLYDFEDLPLGKTLPLDFKWNNVGNAEIVQEDNGNKALRLSGAGYNYIFIGDDFEEDFTVTFRLKMESHQQKGGAHLLFREDGHLFTGRNGYQFCIGDTMNGEYGLELRKRDTSLSDNKYASCELNYEWHDFEISMVGNKVTLKMDGEEVMTHTLTGFDKGCIAIAAYLDTVLFDNILITLH